MPLASSASERIAAVDAARGCAMLMVFLSHIKQHFEATSPDLYWFLLTTTRIATPTFLLLSGFVIFHLMSRDSEGRVNITLIDRALFLLLVAHGLLGLADLSEMGPVDWAFGRSMITDTVGVALLVAVLLRRAPVSVYWGLGLALCTVSWIIALAADPSGEWARRIFAVLFQLKNGEYPAIDAPIVSYVGVFLIGMALSSHLQAPLVHGHHTVLARRLMLYGLGAITLSLVGVLAWHLFKDHASALIGNPDTLSAIRETLDPRGKRPPSPSYLLFYGGTGLLVLAMFFHGRPRAIVDPLRRWTAVVGRASLACFIVQDWLFFLVPRALGLEDIHSVAFWFAYLALCVTVLYALARKWDQLHGNRILTVGLKALLRRDRAGVRATPVTAPRPHRRA
jgi:uncharacterized membrane protein